MNHILIAEDEHLIARLIELTLTRAGYHCTVAEDGTTAAGHLHHGQGRGQGPRAGAAPWRG